MLVNFIYKNKLSTITLPKKIYGKYWIKHEGKNLISIDGEDGKWMLTANRKVKIFMTEKYYKKAELRNESIIELLVGEEKAIVYSEKVSTNRSTFDKYEFSKDGEITIGRGLDNTICYDNNYISMNHAKIVYHNGYWNIQDLNSMNGVFVSNKKVTEKTLEYGNVVFLMGLKIIVGNNYIAVNNPDNKVKVNLPKMTYQKSELLEEEYEDNLIEKKYFQRSPRFKKKIITKTIKIESPPQEETQSDTPLLLTLGPSLTMGLSSAVTAFYTFVNASSTGTIKTMMPTLIASIAMLLGSLLFPIISNLYRKRRSKKREKKRKEKYREYLQEKKKNIEDEINSQTEILKKNYPSIQECQNRIMNSDNSLWERNIYEDNFLEFRIGNGEKNLDCNIQYQEKTFTLEEDELKKEMYEVAQKDYILNNIPITFSFYNNYLTGIVGEEKNRKDFVKGLIYEVVSQYSYDEVKTIFIYNNDSDLEFTKWLPHTFSNDKRFRFIATNTEEVKEVSYYLENEISLRIENSSRKEEYNPYYLVFVFDKNLAQNCEFLNKLLVNKENIGFSVIQISEKQEDLPKDCSAIINLLDSKVYYKNQMMDNISFNPDIYLTANPNHIARKLSNIQLNEESTYQLPNMLSFLQMYGVGKIEHLNILSRWKENDPIKSLAVPIGIDNYGGTFYLDLHEKFHGPHGLIAGMTGSGKSEFIMTFILSLAVNFHPNDVSFILIDYKGGGMAKTFEKLPHTSGIITNLDGAGIQRALTSINSELKRRQRIFAKTYTDLGESNLDIYKYQQLYKNQKVSIPLPHLFIIADEFAELKQQLPDFMNELISIARIGRSLGVHLILATQKPSGSVSGEIWSNSKFKICLKVQETADSNEMIKRPDAAYLKETGRFYLQVGNNEIFELGQSAWSGKKYIPSDKLLDDEESIEVIDNNARVLKRIVIDQGQLFEKNEKEIDAIVNYLNTLQQKENISSLAIWLPPLKSNILLNEIIEKYAAHRDKPYVLEPIVGEYDDPTTQRQDFYRLDLSQNTVLYSSKSESYEMFLNTMIYSLIQNHSSKELNLYLMDFGGQSMQMFRHAPQVGDIIYFGDDEKRKNLFKLLYKEIEDRRVKFADYGGNYFNYLKQSKNSLPNIVVVINNYALFKENYLEDENKIAYLSREGSKYGIFFVISANATNTIRSNLLQNFSQTLVFNMNDASEYAYLLGRTKLTVRDNIGSGLMKLGGTIYEFQTADIVYDDLTNYVNNKCLELKNNDKGEVRAIKTLPKKITINDMIPYIAEDFSYPIGMEKSRLETSYLNLINHYITFVLSNHEEYKDFATNLVNFVEPEYKDTDFMIVDPLQKLTGLNPNIKHIIGSNETNNFIDDFYNTILYRNNSYKDALEKGVQPENYRKQVIFIYSVADLYDGKDNDRVDKLNLALLKGLLPFNVRVVIFEQEKKIKWFSSKKWFNENAQLEEALWFGDGIEEQYTLDGKTSEKGINKLSDNSFAIKLEKGQYQMVKVMTKEEEDES